MRPGDRTAHGAAVLPVLGLTPTLSKDMEREAEESLCGLGHFFDVAARRWVAERLGEFAMRGVLG